MKHRGWTSSNPAKAKQDPDEDMRSSKQGMVATKRRETTETKTIVTQEFEFVNATDPYKNKDPKIRKLIRSHVVNDGVRKRKQMQEQHSKRASKQSSYSKDSESSSEYALYSASTSNASSGSTSQVFEREDKLPWPVSAVSPYSSNGMFPLASLDPHPQLSPIIYYVASIGTAMWPLEDKLRFNPISPCNWFDSALSDDALFHALLYTTSTYAGLISGTTENKESIMHVGRSLKLVNERLKSLRRPGQELQVSMETIGAVSCLAITEVSHKVCSEIRRFRLIEIG